VNRWVIWLPLGLFAAFFVLFMTGLIAPGDREVASQMEGKPLPQFDLPPATSDRPGLAFADFADGEPKLLNIFASWCIPCIAEAPILDQMSRQGIPIYGVAIRDRQEDVEAFLARNGNPYRKIGADNVSSIQLAIGSSGVPETFVIDGKGTIMHQHIGDIRESDIPTLLNELEEARK